MIENRSNATQGLLKGSRSVTQSIANAGAWAAAFGGVAASMVSGAVLIPLGAAILGAGVGFVVSKKIEQAQNSH